MRKQAPQGPFRRLMPEMEPLTAARTATVVVTIATEAGDQKDPDQPFAAVIAAEDTTAVIASVVTSTAVSAEKAAVTAVTE